MTEDLNRLVRELYNEVHEENKPKPEPKYPWEVDAVPKKVDDPHKLVIYYDPNEREDSFKSLKVEGIPTKNEEAAVASCALLRAAAIISANELGCDVDKLYEAYGSAGIRFMVGDLLKSLIGGGK